VHTTHKTFLPTDELTTERLTLRTWRRDSLAQPGHGPGAELAAMRVLLQQWIAEDARLPAPPGPGGRSCASPTAG
jgi:hypothetical protein